MCGVDALVSVNFLLVLLVSRCLKCLSSVVSCLLFCIVVAMGQVDLAFLSKARGSSELYDFH